MRNLIIICILTIFIKNGYLQPITEEQVLEDEEYGPDEEIEIDDRSETEEEESNRNRESVLNIIGGAFEGNINKILNGAFGFTDKEIGEKLRPSILGEDQYVGAVENGSKLPSSTSQKQQSNKQKYTISPNKQN